MSALLCAAILAAPVTCPLLDGQGTLRALTDASGAVIGSRRYSPFGEVVAGSGSLSPLGFTGEPQDATSGLTYLRARYYHPA